MFQWVANFMGSKKNAISFALGIISVLSWGVAEVPQIITNFKRKSAEGLSIIFLFTWILGDLFNVFGCLVEPATLPTQYYTAVLYTVTTFILASQSLYYAHIFPRMKSTKKQHEESEADALMPKREDDYEPVAEGCRFTPASPIPLPSVSSETAKDLYFMSARSLTLSKTPPMGSSTPTRGTPDVGINSLGQPLLNDVPTLQSAPLPINKAMLSVVSLVCVLSIVETSRTYLPIGSPERHILRPEERLLMEGTGGTAESILAGRSSGIGSMLGWGMTAIYLGGRLPQIFLNFRRGNAEGLNPLMFIFALVGNITYVASILVRSRSWSKVRPNLPWIIDASGCVFLDILILLQFIYYRYRQQRRTASTHTHTTVLV